MYGQPSFLTTLGLRQESGTALAGPAVTQGSSEARAFQRCQVWRLKGKERWLSYRAITSSHCWASCSVPGWTRHRDVGRRHMSLPSGCSPPRGRHYEDSDRPWNTMQGPVSQCIQRQESILFLQLTTLPFLRMSSSPPTATPQGAQLSSPCLPNISATCACGLPHRESVM